MIEYQNIPTLKNHYTSGIMQNFESKLTLKVKKLTNTAILPKLAESGSAGYDLFVDKIEIIHDNNILRVYTGISIQPPRGFHTELVARSSTQKKGLILANCIGIIDESYVNEIIANFFIIGKTTPDIKQGDRLCQLILRKTYTVDNIIEVDKLDETNRVGGFGSTGV